MAKASYHKGQRVYVKPVGTWALVEHVIPQWVKGVEEPLRVHYDVGLGREFQAHELAAEEREPERPDGLIETEVWRVLRLASHMRSEGDAGRHPFPGTYPVVCTDEKDWGGWRVPMAEYERDPERIERQSRVIVNAMRFMRVAKDLVEFAADHPQDAAPRVRELAQQAAVIMQAVYRTAQTAPAIAAE